MKTSTILLLIGLAIVLAIFMVSLSNSVSEYTDFGNAKKKNGGIL